nr:glycoprotein gp2 [uncultured bacterium]
MCAPFRRRLFAPMAAATLFAATNLQAQSLTVNITAPIDGTNIVMSPTNVVVVSVSASSDFNVTNLTLRCNDVAVRSFNPVAGQTNLSVQLPLFLPSATVDTFTVVARDASGAIVTSSPVTVTISFDATPAAPTNALVLWLAADTGVTTDPNDGQSITTWADQSGHGNDAQQPVIANSPRLRDAGVALNFAPVARFNVLDTGVARFMIVSNSPSIAGFTTNFTFLTVAEENDSGATYAIMSETTGSYQPNPFRWHFNPGGSIGVDLGAGGNPTVVNNAGTTLAGTYNILGVRAGNNVLSQTVNFTNGTPTTIGTAAVSDAGIGLNIGRGSGLFTGMYGNITELMCYSNRLSDIDFLLAQSYLAYKYLPGMVVVQLANPAPVVVLNNPTNGAGFHTVTNNNILFSATTSSTNPLYSVTYFANGSLVGSNYVKGVSGPYQFNYQVQLAGSFNLTVVATDILGLAGTSAPVAVTVTGPSLVPPTSGLALWLKPNAGMVTNVDGSGTLVEWDDQSGKTNNAYQPVKANAPALVANAINGLPAAYFNQLTNISPQYLDVTSAASIQKSSFSIITVAKPLDQNGNYDIISKTSGGGVPNPFEWRFDTGGAIETAVGDGNTKTASNISTLVPANGTFNILSTVVGSGAIKQYVGFSPSTITSLGSAAIVDGGTPMRIGNRGSLDATMRGYIAEILYYDHVLTDTERTLAVGYLANKYALNYPSFTNTPPSVAILSPTNGTTVTAGANVTLSVSASAGAIAAYLTTIEFLANGTVLSSASVSNQSIIAPYIANLATPGSYSFTVRATDNYGFQTTSTAVAVTASAVGGAIAAPTNDLVLWLKADAGVTIDPNNGLGSITTWADQSGNGNDAVQPVTANSPLLRSNILNGLPVARFNVLDTGAPRFMTVASAPSIANFTTNFTFIAVTLENDSGADYAIMSETTGSYAPNPFRWRQNAGGNSGFDLGAGGTPTVVNNSGVGSSAGVPAIRAVRAGNNVLRQTVNLNPGNSSTIGNAAIADAGVGLNIGQGSANNLGMYGYIAEIMCYSNRLSDASFVQAQAYLGGKYGISLSTFALPATGAPVLSVGRANNALTVSWPLNFTGFVLESRTNLTSGTWSPVATNPLANQVTLPITGPAAQFFRLRQ